MSIPRPSTDDIREFRTELRTLLDRYQLTPYRVADVSPVDRATLSRILSGKVRKPKRVTVMQICHVLASCGALMVELDRLLIAAGYAPQYLIWQVSTSQDAHDTVSA